MTKKEKIKEGIDLLLRDVFRHFQAGEWVDTTTVAKKILEYEASQGVVIKVERELPNLCEYEKRRLEETPESSETHKLRHSYDVEIATVEGVQEKMLEAGYVAVEPLV